MRKYKIYLTGGHTKVLKARNPTQAKHKYYGSNDHFKTERSIIKITRKVKTKRR